MRPAEKLEQLLERPLLLLTVAIALQWLTTVVVALRADSVDLGAAALLNVLVLGPLALAAALGVAASIGGVALGAWTLLVWVALPWLAPLYTLSKYDTTMRDDVLPLVLGLTGDAGYAEGVAILAALALLTRRTRPTRAAAVAVLLGLAAIWLSRSPDVDGFSLDALQANLAGLR